MTQEERLDYLVAKFKEDSEQYKNLQVGESSRDRQIALRSLMNIRMPGLMDDKTMLIQDEYLSRCLVEKGIVTPGTRRAAPWQAHLQTPFRWSGWNIC